MIHVLMVTPRFIQGGIESLLLDIFKYNNRTKVYYELFLYSCEVDCDLISLLKKLKVKVYYADSNRYRGICKKIYEATMLYRHLKRHKYDIVHIHQTALSRSLDLAMARAARVKVRILHAHGSGGIKRKKLIKVIVRPIFKKILDLFATDYFACSFDAAEYLFSNSVIKKKKYYIVKNGIEISRFAYNESSRKKIRQDMNISSNTFLLGNVGRLTYYKNHVYMFNVLAELKKMSEDYKLLLVGDGELRDELDMIIKRMGLDNDVIMFGNSRDIGEMLSAMDCFIFPSICEGLGIAAIEAQCNGLPVVMASHIPIEACINENVYQIPLTSIDEWVKRIHGLKMERINDLSKISSAGYNIETTVYELENKYAMLVKE